ncbi:MAG: serine hydrolase [Candidatus Staskawiczbacteria bacterium]|jgi:D-alanyl-D-alanine carboxypeptidase
MKQKFFFTIFIFVAIVFSQNADALTPLPEQQLEILQNEILLLQAMNKNYNLYETPVAGAYIAVDIATGKVLLAKNANEKFPMASVAKLMSAVVTLENINMKKKIVLTEKMLLPDGQTPALYEGLKITASDLLKATLIQSSNDSAEALSYFLGKTKFIKLMNQKAKKLGMSKTVYYDTNGLNIKNKSTATDLAKLISYIYKKHPQILEITKNNDFWLPDQTGKMLKFKNGNGFYYMNNFVGGKSGYLDEAKNTFDSVFTVNGRPIAIAALYMPNRAADIFSILRNIK